MRFETEEGEEGDRQVLSKDSILQTINDKIYGQKKIKKKKKKKKKKMGNIKKIWYLLLHKFRPPGFHIRPANGEFHQSFLTYRGNIRLKSKISWFYINLKCNDWFGEAMVLFAKWFCWEYP